MKLSPFQWSLNPIHEEAEEGLDDIVNRSAEELTVPEEPATEVATSRPQTVTLPRYLCML